MVMDRPLQNFRADCFEEYSHILGGLHHNIFWWIVLDGDGQTTTKILGGLF